MTGPTMPAGTLTGPAMPAVTTAGIPQGTGTSAYFPSTAGTVPGTNIPVVPSTSSSATLFPSTVGAVPGTNIPVVPSTASTGFVPVANAMGGYVPVAQATQTVPAVGTTVTPVDQDGFVSYGGPTSAPVILPPSPPPRLRFGADANRITGATSDDPANSAGNNNPFGVDRSRPGSVPTPSPSASRSGRLQGQALPPGAAGPATAAAASSTDSVTAGGRVSAASVQSAEVVTPYVLGP
eukprot:jgi/Botrbrau1/1344/Bobra.0063s0055.1